MKSNKPLQLIQVMRPRYNLRGLTYMRLGETDLARESFRRALALAPRDPDIAHNLRGCCANNASTPKETRFSARWLPNLHMAVEPSH